MDGRIPPKPPVTVDTPLADIQNTEKAVESKKPVVNLPSTKGSFRKSTKLSKRKVSNVENQELPSVKRPKRKKPHHNYGYMGGGAAAMMAGAGVLALVPPVSVVGIPVFVMGLMAYAYAFCNFGDMPQSPPDDHNQQQDNDKRKKEKDDRDKNNPANNSETTADGKFLAEPVDYSGGQVNPPTNGPPAQLPQLPPKPDYTGPGWQDIYNTMTQQFAMPPAMAHNFMNDYGKHLVNLKPEQQNDPNAFVNMPMAMNYANNYMQQVGSTLPAGTMNYANHYVQHLGGTPAAGGGITQPGIVPVGSPPSPSIVINNINGKDGNGAPPVGENRALPFNFNNWTQVQPQLPSEQVVANIKGEITNTWNENLQQKNNELEAYQETNEMLDEAKEELKKYIASGKKE